MSHRDHTAISRRTILRRGGAALALPWLGAFRPRAARAQVFLGSTVGGGACRTSRPGGSATAAAEASAGRADNETDKRHFSWERDELSIGEWVEAVHYRGFAGGSGDAR